MYISFNGQPSPDELPTITHDYASDQLDFVPMSVNGSTRYMSVAREADTFTIPVWVAEKRRVAIMDLEDDTPFIITKGVYA
jgi:hypothetical protein